MIYLDYTAAIKPDDEVLDLFVDTYRKYWANPNSAHVLGCEVNKKINESTNKIKSLLDVKDYEVIYTSGSTEANNLAVKGVCERYKNRGKHILVSALEHNSIISSVASFQEVGYEVEVIPVGSDGVVDIEWLKSKLRDDTILVSVCYVDSELGIRQPISDIGNILKEYPNCVFHTDATQAVGKIPVSFENVDLVTITPHKFYGLNGIGALIRRKNINLKPQMLGGRSTTIFRSGTPDSVNIICMAKALEIALNNLDERLLYVEKINNYVRDKLSSYDKVYINSPTSASKYTLNVSVGRVRSMQLVEDFEKRGVIISPKTSCCPINSPSKLVYALTNDKGRSQTSVRISFSYFTTQEEIDRFLKIFDELYKEYKNNGKI